MRGIIFTEFALFVEEALGLMALERAIAETDLASGGAYTRTGNYPYAELEALLGTLLEQNPSLQADEALFSFGAWLIKRFQTNYSSFFEGHSDAISFLQTIDDHIHTEVRKLYPDAVPPSVKLEALEGGVFRILYQSHRPLAGVAHGLAAGAIELFGGQYEMSDMTISDGGKQMTATLNAK